MEGANGTENERQLNDVALFLISTSCVLWNLHNSQFEPSHAS